MAINAQEKGMLSKKQTHVKTITVLELKIRNLTITAEAPLDCS